ncbi:Catalase [Caballeronia hypogeia]|uniref:catalase n=1 Tax=Caballeronia hypogeia TaxID=1777140 RepID=A0A158CDG9_9BURK|nr:catalase [Caballeronia hypogeia]SAK80349.1 Catalase [Caballeronia hypogeia]
MSAGNDGTGWIDKPDDATTITRLVTKIGEQQAKLASSRHTSLGGQVDRAQHQKQVLGAFGTLRITDEIPDCLKFGPFAKRDASADPILYRVACRISNGQPCPQADTESDVRGIAIKFFTGDGVETDLLMTNEGGRSHARDAKQFMAVSDIIVAKLADGVTGGLKQTLHELRTGELHLGEGVDSVAILVKQVGLHPVASVTLEDFWGSVVQLGPAAIKYSLHHFDSTPSGTQATGEGENYLRADLFNRLEQGPVGWWLGVQLFVDEATTPVNDASVAWKSPVIQIGELEIAAQPSREDEANIDMMAFNPANGFMPLGITHARREVYAASAANRRGRGLLSSDQARALLLTR